LPNSDSGLSDFGVAAVEEMNRRGVLVDLSHAGNATTLDAIEVSRAPVAITHSCVAALSPNPRNVSDEAIRLLAKKGGVMGITAFPCFLSPKSTLTIETYLDHIEYVAKLAGIDTRARRLWH
jgi:membrane dipeptidase